MAEEQIFSVPSKYGVSWHSFTDSGEKTSNATSEGASLHKNLFLNSGHSDNEVTAGYGSWKSSLSTKTLSKEGALFGILENTGNSGTLHFMRAMRAKYGGLRYKDSKSGNGSNDGDIGSLSNSALYGQYDIGSSEMSTDGSIFSAIKRAWDSPNPGSELGKIFLGRGGTPGGVFKELSSMFENNSVGGVFSSWFSTFAETLSKQQEAADKISDPTARAKAEAEISALSAAASAFKSTAVSTKDGVLDYISEAFKSAKGSVGEVFDLFNDGGFTMKGAIKKAGTKFIKWVCGVGDFVNNMEGGNDADPQRVRRNIMCMPPLLTDIVDPNGRAYNNNIMTTQHVLSIIPGVLDNDAFRFGKDFGLSNAAMADELSKFAKGEESSIIMDSSSSLLSLLQLSWDKDKRFGHFKPQLGRFLRIYMLIMTKLTSRLSPNIIQAANVPNDSGDVGYESLYTDAGKRASCDINMRTSGWGAIRFALNNSTSVMESGSNNFNDGPLSALLGGVSQQVRHIRNGVKELVGTEALDGLVKSGGEVTAAIQGENVNLPKLWDGSDFSRSYTLNFRLESPYGDPDSILEWVYKPLAALMAISLPIYKTVYGFGAPFNVRMDCPGWFTIDCGYISSIDIRKAPDEGSWSANGMPSCVEVTMSVVDIYPSLALSVGPASLSNNYGLQAYLDNLGGCSYKEIYSGGSFSNAFREKAIMAKMLPSATKSVFNAKASYETWNRIPLTFGMNGVR